VGAHRRRHVDLEPRVMPVRLDAVDDLAVEMRADQADVVAVVGERHGQGGAHQAGAEDGDGSH
jgi:hypothetical protein